MINKRSIKNIKISPTTAIVVGVFLFLIIMFFVFKNAKERFESLIESKYKLENQNILLEKEKQVLQNQVNKYVNFSDSINKVIESNNKLSNEKIKSLFQLTNDELRKIAND